MVSISASFSTPSLSLLPIILRMKKLRSARRVRRETRIPWSRLEELDPEGQVDGRLLGRQLDRTLGLSLDDTEHETPSPRDDEGAAITIDRLDGDLFTRFFGEAVLDISQATQI